jgi:hypothetical protein
MKVMMSLGMQSVPQRGSVWVDTATLINQPGREKYANPRVSEIM